MKKFIAPLIFAVALAPAASAKSVEGNAEPVACSTAEADLINMKKEGDADDLRKITKGRPIFYFEAPPETATLEVKEVSRQTRFAEELKSLVGAILKGQEKALSAAERKCFRYTQEYSRSRISLVAKDAAGKALAEMTVVTGPAEHWYLTADMPVSDVKQLKYDSASNTVVEKQKPASIYLGINYRPLGDVLSDYPSADFKNNLALKLLLKASSKPSESMGFGIGYSFSFAEIFVARMRTKNDESVPGSNLGYRDSTVFGVSFDIAKGIGWLKK